MATNHVEEPDDQREATQLHIYDHDAVLRPNGSVQAIAVTPEPWYKTRSRPITAFWKRQVVATVPHNACRDHFALERTFLGYLRTSLALSFVAVIIAQFFRLEHTQTPDPVFGYYDMGTPLACVCIVAAIIVLLLAFYRFWRQQNAMLRGKVHAGGWEVYAIGLTVFLVVLTLFVLSIAADSRRDSGDT